MTVVTGEKEWLLRWGLCDPMHRTALCRIRGNKDFLPENPLRFHSVTARTAAALSLSAADEKLLRDNLKELGYRELYTAAFSRPARDTIGMGVGSRVKDDLLEIAVVLRGTNGDEWYSNFDVGYTAEHSGYAKAADFAELQLSDYVFTHAIGREPAFFITGYSRGGSVANLLAKRLCDRYGLERVCAYSLAAPAVTISRRVHRYGCIFNLVRQEDFFTRVPLTGWGYSRYGRDIPLSGAGDITEGFQKLTGEDYIGFTHTAAVDNFLCSLQRLAPNVHAYYRRRRQVGGRMLSLYDFMRAVADMLSDHMDEAAAELFFSAMLSDYADLVSFLSSGADLSELIHSTAAVPPCSVTDSHSPAAYMAALDAYLTQQPAMLAHARPDSG